MQTTKEKILQYLNETDCSFKEINHKPAGSAEEYHNELGTRYEQQAKALFIRYKKEGEKGFVVVAIQAQKKCDLDQIKRLINAKEVRMADKEQLKTETGCNFGELPPLGKPFGFRLLMDKQLLNEDLIYFNCGDLSFSLAVDPKNIDRIEQPMMF